MLRQTLLQPNRQLLAPYAGPPRSLTKAVEEERKFNRAEAKTIRRQNRSNRREIRDAKARAAAVVCSPYTGPVLDLGRDAFLVLMSEHGYGSRHIFINRQEYISAGDQSIIELCPDSNFSDSPPYHIQEDNGCDPIDEWDPSIEIDEAMAELIDTVVETFSDCGGCLQDVEAELDHHSQKIMPILVTVNDIVPHVYGKNFFTAHLNTGETVSVIGSTKFQKLFKKKVNNFRVPPGCRKLSIPQKFCHLFKSKSNGVKQNLYVVEPWMLQYIPQRKLPEFGVL